MRRARPGDLVRLGGVEGTFVLPDPVPEKLLFISAGSGITPIASMLRSLVRNDAVGDVVHIHSARTRDSVIFGERLDRFHAAGVGFDLRLRITSEQGRIAPADLDALCPDWRERHTFASGPGEMLDDLTRHWELEGDPELLEMERFQPLIGGEAGGGEGGDDPLRQAAGSRPPATAPRRSSPPARRPAPTLPYGCRMGICHTCVGELRRGQVRDLRTGEVHGSEGEMVRTCVNAPEGPIEIAL